MSREELEKIYEKFVGEGKVQSISLDKVGDDSWQWTYREGNRGIQSIQDKDRDFLERMHLEFGGRNTETCRAPDRFMELNNWGWDDLLQLGHRITKIKARGLRSVKNKKRPIIFPDGTGSSQPIRSKRNIKDDSANFIEKETECLEFTRAFRDHEEFGNFMMFLRTNEDIKHLKFYIHELGTETKSTKDQCLWTRQNAGDGTKRMILELQYLNTKHFTECRRADLYNAADDMFDTPCKRLEVKKQRESHKTICFFAAEDGKVDITGFEPV